MSDMTDPELLQKWAEDVIDRALYGDQSFSTNATEPFVPDGANIFIWAIQKEMLKRFGWRDKPPDSEGWWTLWRIDGPSCPDGKAPWMVTFWYGDHQEENWLKWRITGDLWLKLRKPEVTR